MKRLKKLEPIVREVLRNEPAARKDDFILVKEVYSDFIPLNMPLGTALENHKRWSLPPFASIIRVRRKLQLEDPSLCDAETVEQRAEAEADYVDYAREG